MLSSRSTCFDVKEEGEEGLCSSHLPQEIYPVECHCSLLTTIAGEQSALLFQGISNLSFVLIPTRTQLLISPPRQRRQGVAGTSYSDQQGFYIPVHHLVYLLSVVASVVVPFYL